MSLSDDSGASSGEQSRYHDHDFVVTKSNLRSDGTSGNLTPKRYPPARDSRPPDWSAAKALAKKRLESSELPHRRPSPSEPPRPAELSLPQGKVEWSGDANFLSPEDSSRDDSEVSYYASMGVRDASGHLRFSAFVTAAYEAPAPPCPHAIQGVRTSTRTQTQRPTHIDSRAALMYARQHMYAHAPACTHWCTRTLACMPHAHAHTRPDMLAGTHRQTRMHTRTHTQCLRVCSSTAQSACSGVSLAHALAHAQRMFCCTILFFECAAQRLDEWRGKVSALRATPQSARPIGLERGYELGQRC
jgi:hypothetical protein